MKSLGTPCRNCVNSNKQTWEHPCCDCISNEDIILAHINPDHAVDFAYYEERKEKHGN